MLSPLIQIIIPFFLSALVVILVMFIAEKYGSKAGGILGTLPSTIIVAFLFIALNKGTTFASEAAAVVPAELGFNVIFLLIIALLIHRSIPLTFITAFIIWTICSISLIIFQMNNIYLSLTLYLTIVIISFLYLEHKKQIPSMGSVKVHYTLKKMLFRGILAGIIIALAVFLSNVGSIIF